MLNEDCMSPKSLPSLVATIANGGDNLGVYVPLFATAREAIATTCSRSL